MKKNSMIPPTGIVGSTGLQNNEFPVGEHATSFEPLNHLELPGYAQFLLDNKLEDLANRQIKLAERMHLPQFSFFSSLEGESLDKMAKDSIRNWLEYIASNRADDYIKASLHLWQSNQSPLINKEQFGPQDVTAISYIRRRSLRELLSEYTTDLIRYQEILGELDQVLSRHDASVIGYMFDVQEDLHNEIQSRTQMGNWRLDLQTNKLNWSDEMFKIYEMEPEHLPEEMTKYNHPEDRERVAEKMKEARSKKNPFDFFFRVLLKSGKIKFLHAKGQTVLDKQSSTESILGTLQDVTLQTTTENDLADNQIFIRKVAELAPSIIAVYNPRTGQYSYINNAFRYELGYDPAVVLRQGAGFLLSIVHPDDLAELTRKNQEALNLANHPGALREPEPIAEFVYRMRHANGHYRWFQTYATVFSRNRQYQVEEVLNISADITEQIQVAEELENKNLELQKNEERYHKMTEQVEDYAIILLNKEGFIENWNKGAERIKGYKAEEVIGKHFRIFYSKQDRDDLLPERLLATALREGKATHEGWRVRKNGETFWGYTVITTLHDENNEVFGFSKVTRDLTEKKEAEEMLRQFAENLRLKNNELEEINRELESFSLVASHDLQEPLRKIKTFLSFIMSNEMERLSPVSRDYFERVVASADRMQNLIEALLNFSKISTKNLVFEMTDLNNILDEAKKDLSGMIADTHTTILSDRLPTLRVVPFQIQQLFCNLINNAIKYRKPDLPPFIRVNSLKIPSSGRFATSGAQSYHRIMFSDNGIGFEQQYAEKIFEWFQRLHGKKEYPGSGIGLAICKKIVRNHHGIIEATGQPGVGARFDLYLPEE